MHKIGCKSKIRKYKKWLCSSLLRRIQIAAPNKNYCLLCLSQKILCEWMKLDLVTEKDNSEQLR
jgi:RNA polymerase subunit RPABC4/transcription elongation factor Spt4